MLVALAGATGLALQQLPIWVGANVSVSFASVPPLVASIVLGPLAGTAAALLATLPGATSTFALWLVLVHAGEAAAVAAGVARGTRPLMASLAYWIVVGLPAYCVAHWVAGTPISWAMRKTMPPWECCTLTPGQAALTRQVSQLAPGYSR